MESEFERNKGKYLILFFLFDKTFTFIVELIKYYWEYLTMLFSYSSLLKVVIL